MTADSDEDVELLWPGKYTAPGERTPLIRHHPRLDVREVHGEPERGGESWINRLVVADNLLALDGLLDQWESKVDLIYIDPPFATGGIFEVVVPTGDAEGGGELRLPAYRDRWPGGAGGFLRMLDPRLRLIHHLLAPTGSLYVHVDPTIGHAVKLMLDEVFGSGGFQREIVWRIGWVSGFKSRARNWIRNHDLIYFYVKDPRHFTFNKIYVPHPPGYKRRDGAPARAPGIPVDDVWNAGSAELALQGAHSLDSIQIKSFSGEKTGYATQKNESLLDRIITASSNPGDLVLDAFCGSGTTLAVAERLGRRWIGVDASPLAVQIARKRLLAMPEVRPFEVVDCDRAEVEARSKPTSRSGVSPAETIARWWGGELGSVPGLHRIQGSRALWVGSPRTPVSNALIEQAVRAALQGRLSALDIIGHTFERDLPSPSTPGLDVTLLQVTRDAWSEDNGFLRWLERPTPQVELEGLERGEVTVHLKDYGYRHPERLTVDPAPAIRHFADWIDGWMVDWDMDAGGPFRVKAKAFRTGRERALSLRLGPWMYRPEGPVILGVRLLDVLGNIVDLRFHLAPSGSVGGFRVDRQVST